MRNEKGELEITDRELIIGLYDLLGAMCKRLIGETPHIRLGLGNDDYCDIVTCDWRIKWERDKSPHNIYTKSDAEFEKISGRRLNPKEIKDIFYGLAADLFRE